MRPVTPRRPGRPKSGKAALTQHDVIAAALTLLDTGGEPALTMRALATSLGVTPMALYHHVGSRDQLTGLLVQQVFGTPEGWWQHDAPHLDRIARIMSGYVTRATAHPALLLLVFRTPSALTGPLREITQTLTETLRDMDLPDPLHIQWRDLLIDHAHGFILSDAMQHDPKGALPGYHANLSRLLSHLARDCGQPAPDSDTA
ncbi:TetR/AcrR family transcriptional regulator [Pseudooceanicola sp. C21-150M6]|uniref:TetR/AcrR family transcriptional regulator n=1 Tax=Pseudooceanicola sp. C21-150M6 TaxID=3434355 RepID=UPI003D7F68B9